MHPDSTAVPRWVESAQKVISEHQQSAMLETVITAKVANRMSFDIRQDKTADPKPEKPPFLHPKLSTGYRDIRQRRGAFNPEVC